MNCYAIVHHNHVCIYSMKDTYKDSARELRKNVVLKHFDAFFKDIKKLKKVYLSQPIRLIFLKRKS